MRLRLCCGTRSRDKDVLTRDLSTSLLSPLFSLFERTVDIVQSLPKTGPIQTSYEEKLALYSLYKQATEGNVRSKRPGMLDMLGRAKWDAWSNRRGLGSQDAKQLYVESMLKTLRKFGDRPQAIALIEELESFSGDVAQRVMSVSLARAGSDSDASSDDLSPRLMQQQRQSYEHEQEEDERDGVAQLPRAGAPASLLRQGAAGGPRSGQRTPMSIGDASAMAVRGEPAGPLEDTDSEEDEGERDDSVMARPGSSLAAGAPRAQQGRSSLPSMPHPSQPQQRRPGPWQRPSGSIAGQSDSRPLYAPHNAARYPGPSASEAGGMMGGGAGASLYSAVGPSARPTPSEQHYYHRHGPGAPHEGGPGSARPYAASSIGGRSGGGGGGGAASGWPPQRGQGSYGRGGVGAPGAGDVDLALQSIQASLAALHERLNRVEGGKRPGDKFGAGGSSSGRGAGRRFGRGALSSGYRAVADALHDIALLLGLRGDGRVGAAPSTYRGDGAESATSRGGAAGRRQGAAAAAASARPPAFAAFARLCIALVNLALRVALDATSVVVVLSLLLLLLRRVTGRGDPLLMLRLLRRWTGIGGNGVGGHGAAVAVGTGAAALQRAIAPSQGTDTPRTAS